MQKINFDQNWKFILEKDCSVLPAFGFRKCGSATGPAGVCFHEGLMRDVDLPHDFAIEMLPNLKANTGRGGRPVSRYMPTHLAPDGDSHVECASVGWYRKHFSLEGVDEDKRIFLEFEGAYRDYTVFVNGIYIARHESGYTPAVYDVTDQVHFEGGNVISVRVDASQPEGWWYEGAGIYRHVNLLIKDAVYIPAYTTFVRADVTGEVRVSSAICNSLFTENKQADIACRVLDANGACVAEASLQVQAKANEQTEFGLSLFVKSPALWSPDEPNLYTAELCAKGRGFCQKERISFGFRSFAYDPNTGMTLNGKPIKVRGACVHQDFGGFGVALPEEIARYKIKQLKEMGVNAYRSSHHCASADILKACDELGMLVMDEVRLFGSSPEALKQMDETVCANRNHASIFMWSIGNEEIECDVQSTPFGQKMAKTAYAHLKKLDDTRAITYGANNGCIDSGAAEATDLRGFNYIRNAERLMHDIETEEFISGYHIDRYHKEHPNTVIIGTEEGSNFLCRDAGKADYTKAQAIGTGESTMRGGSTPEGWVKFFEKRPYLVGAFMWTGFDYNGEPCPFPDSSVISSFGAIDLVGIPKNAYYYYRSCWKEEPALHLMPHWDFEDGDVARVGVYTNCEKVSLYLNGKKVGEKTLQYCDSALFDVPFEAGRLEAIGEKDGVIYRTHLDTPDTYEKIAVDAQREGELVIFDVSLTDKNGNICRRCDRELAFEVTDGEILGVGNGDPASLEADKYLESEELRIIGDASLTVTKDGKKEPYVILRDAKDAKVFVAEGIVDSQFKGTEFEPRHAQYEDEHRHIWCFTAPGEKDEEIVIEGEIENAKEYTFLEFERLCGEFEISLNGEVIGTSFKGKMYQTLTHYQTDPWRFACTFNEGKNRLLVKMKGTNTKPLGIFGSFGISIGKKVKPVWQRRTFYGRARVFAKANGEQMPTLICKEI